MGEVHNLNGNTEGAVIKPPQFNRDLSVVAAFKEAGYVTEDVPPLSELDLPELRYGEEVLGDMTPDEALLFRNYAVLQKQLDKAGRFLSSTVLKGLGDAVEAHEEEAYLKGESTPIDEATAKPFFEIQSAAETLKATLFHMLRKRFGEYTHVIGVRTRGRVAKGNQKW